ncbi:MAG: hypothetical protein WBQ60_06285 [Asticcacaulis sp.]
MYIKTLGLLVLSALTLSACTPRVKAPRDQGTCYFIGHPKSGEIKFNVLSRNEPDVEHCAVRLYNARMGMMQTNTQGEYTAGAYQGNFLFATGREVRFAQHYEGTSFPLLVKAPDGRLVAPGSVVQQEAPSSGQITVEIPKDLPKMSSDKTP